MCLRRAPEKYIAGAALDRADVDHIVSKGLIIEERWIAKDLEGRDSGLFVVMSLYLPDNFTDLCEPSV
jgi:hypothetical protein